ncbi:NAD(P)/FAD-dependent oxidoreductase [Egicoccus sp. AB-alg2]|uniref:NAD(P)/FAD-dependent oxidoreductase n=1 Tax=Egicoccus sp. AB-alg2 TaxID=3242693 RepID=UPI00359DB4A4
MQVGERPEGSDRRHHVVVVGAGFAGLNVARRLGRAASDTPLRITLVDRHNHHTFQPLLYQVATAGLESDSIGHSVRGLFRRLPVDVRLGTVVGVDWDARRVELDDGASLDFDTVVFAAGAESADYGIEGVSEHAFMLKWIPDALRLRNHLLRQFERVESHPELIEQGALNFVVAGGGPTGVELSGAIAELVEHVVQRDHPNVDIAKVRVVLVEMMDALLGTYSQASQRYARRALEERGVEVRTDTAIEAVEADEVRLSDGERIPTATVVWTAGVRANPLADVLGLEQGKGGRVKVAGDLRVPGRADAFVVGDLAAVTGKDGQVLPQLAPVAIQQGQHVADQIVRLRRGEPTAPFRYRDRGTMATIGRRDAIAELALGVKLHGSLAWLSWLGLHLLYLVGFRNRVAVLGNWAYAYLTYDRAARLIIELEPPPGDDDDRAQGAHR